MNLEFEIGGKTYMFFPITIRTYYQIQKLAGLEEVPTEAKFSIVASMTNCPIEILKQAQYEVWLLIWAEAENQIELAASQSSPIETKLDFKGKKYVLPTPEQMTIGEFADLEILFSQPDINNNLHTLAAMLYREVDVIKVNKWEPKPYDSTKTAERAELFLDLPITIIKSANAFFLSCADSLVKNTAQSLLLMEETKQMAPQDLQQLQNLVQQGLGGTSSISFLEKTLSNFQKQRAYQFGMPSISSLGKQSRLKNLIRRWTRFIVRNAINAITKYKLQK